MVIQLGAKSSQVGGGCLQIEIRWSGGAFLRPLNTGGEAGSHMATGGGGVRGVSQAESGAREVLRRVVPAVLEGQ